MQNVQCDIESKRSSFVLFLTLSCGILTNPVINFSDSDTRRAPTCGFTPESWRKKCVVRFGPLDRVPGYALFKHWWRKSSRTGWRHWQTVANGTLSSVVASFTRQSLGVCRRGTCMAAAAAVPRCGCVAELRSKCPKRPEIKRPLWNAVITKRHFVI